MRFVNDIINLNNVYEYTINENRQAELPPEIKKGIEELAKLAVEGDEEAIKMLTDPKYAEQILSKAQQQGNNEPVNEAFERFRANMGSKFGGGDPIDRRYELFLKDVNGHLWEIDKDSKLLNVEPAEVNKFISDIIKVEPKVDKQGKLLQKIGYTVGRAVGTGMFAAPFAIAATHLAPAIGLYGISAKLLGGALAGGGKTLNILKNNQLSKGEKIGEIIKAVGAGYFMTTGYQPDVPYTPSSSNAVTPNTDTVAFRGKEFPELHNTPYDNLSVLDRSKEAVADLLRSKGITGSSGGLDGIASPRIMNAMDMANINTSGEYQAVLKGMQGLSDETLRAMQGDTNYAIKVLKSLNK
jgi:hypothetical protein